MNVDNSSSEERKPLKRMKLRKAYQSEQAVAKSRKWRVNLADNHGTRQQPLCPRQKPR
jgi:hypothetical protein